MGTGPRAVVDSPVGALSAYVPTIAIDWLTHEPGVRHRRVDASMVFVDISGFTALSERLAGRGREGAEEITALLEHVFERLLAVAYANRGSLIKFGGDALFLLFRGDDHPARAAASADGMRRELLEIGALESLAGRVRLGMTVGAHSGEYDLFLVGDTHRELIITGPAASRVVELEGTAATGEVLISAEMAQRIDRGWLGSRRDDAFELGRTPGAALGDGLQVVPKRNDATLAVPTAIRRYLVAGGGGAEHRQAVVAFLAYHGSDELLARDGPDACADALEELVRRTSAACDAHDITLLGSDVAPGGGKLIFVGGAPVGHDDDIERVLRAARDIVAEPHPFEVHIGVNPGPLFAGVVGPPYRLTYTVMGDTVNLAARLAYEVGDRQVLTPVTTLARTRSRFDATPVQPLRVKGKAEPIDAATVGAPREARLDIRDPLPMLGRERELEVLDATIAATERDGGRIVELVGPPGIGKSRLLREFRDRHPERRLYYGGCTSYEQSTPYFAFRGLLRFLLELDDEADGRLLCERLATVSAELVPWAALVGHVVDIEVEPSEQVAALDPAFLPAKLRTVVGDLVEAVLPRRSILRVEDVQWIDEASRELLSHLATVVLPRTAWLLVLTSREAVFPDLAHETIPIEALTADAVERLAHAAAERGLVSLDLAVQLAQRAQGNPLFLQELLALSGTSGDDEIPDSVERLIGARLDQLHPLHRDLLRHAALLGNRFDLDLLRSITGEVVDERDLDVLSAFVSRGDGSDYVFEHDLYREVAYHALPYRLRRRLHDRAGGVIETRFVGRTEEAAEILALHYYRAGRHDRAWHYNRVAAHRARDRHANADAVRFYRWALDSGRRCRAATASDRLELRTAMAELLEVMGSYRQAEAVLAKARREAPPDRRPELWYRSGIVRERLGDMTQALRFYGRAVRVLQVDRHPTSRELAIRVRQRRAEVRILQHRRGEVIDELHRLLDEAVALGSPELIANAHYDLAWALDDPEQRATHAALALELLEGRGRPRDEARVHMAIALRADEDVRWDEAAAAFGRAAIASETAGDPVGAATATANQSVLLLAQGRFDEAHDGLERVLHTFRAAGHTIGIAMASGHLGRAKATLGRHDEAAPLLERSVQLLRGAQWHVFADEMEARLAEAHLFAGRRERARISACALLDRRPQSARARSVAHRVLGTLAALDSDGQRAVEELATAHRAAGEEQMLELLAITEWALWWAADACAVDVPEGLGRAPDELERTFHGLGIVADPLHLVLGRSPVSPGRV